ncbi:MAG: uridine diphosphate-N-acetylglucosamine-binding protein YvcK [Clostridiaceae bacterium]
MKFFSWLRPGIKIKRWIMLAVFGLLLIIVGMMENVKNGRFYTASYVAFYIFLVIAGIFIVYVSISNGMMSFIALINKGYINYNLDSRKLGNLIYEKRLLVKGPKVVAIGGGTGLSTMLRGLKHYTSNITAIVTVADDGGGSGDLREDLGILPPGDIRNCILSLSDTEPLMEELLQYRFTDGRLKNQSFGNLFLAAMDGISTNFEEAVRKMSDVLAVTGKVVPVTLDNMKLKARLKNGEVVEGESNIPEKAIELDSSIESIMIEPADAKALDEAVEAIRDADAIILGPGSLYTSVIPNLMVKGIAIELLKCNALKIYISNIMTQPGETDGYDVADHIEAINKHVGGAVIDYVIANVEELDEDLNKKYEQDHSEEVMINEERIRSLGAELIRGNLVKINDKGFIRHNSEELAAIVIETIMDKKLFFDRKKILEYFYLSERLKENNKNNL